MKPSRKSTIPDATAIQAILMEKYNMDTDFLSSLTKGTRKAFLKGEISIEQAYKYFKKNKDECESFTGFGYSIKELYAELRKTHNPLLKEKITKIIEDAKEGHRQVGFANELNLKKLEQFKENALGIGLRKLIKQMYRIYEEYNDDVAYLTFLLLKTEFANLSAKQDYNISKKKEIYEQKEILLDEVTYMADDLGLRYGVSSRPGKNACYLIMLYLPNEVQVTWHCNNSSLTSELPPIFDEWDGQVAMNMEKIISFAGERYGKLINPDYCLEAV